MSNHLEIVEAQALKLSFEERVQLAERLITSLFEDHEIQDAWAVEVERRIEEIECGRTKLIPAADSITRARRNQMIASVSPEAERELSEVAIFYTRETHVEVGLAFTLEYKRALALLRP